MKDEEKLIEVMAELLAEVHEMRLEIKGMRDDFNKKMDTLGTKVERVEEAQSKTNVSIGKLRLSVMRLADWGELFALKKKFSTRLHELICLGFFSQHFVLHTKP